MFESRVVCICGLPGIGSVGKVAVDYLAIALDCSTVKPFFSRSFPAQVVVQKGLAELLHAELKAPKEKRDMFILSGDAQPLDIVEMYRLAGEILETIRAKGVSDVIALAAYVGDVKEKVLGAASDADSAALLMDSGIPLLRSGAIGGMNGLLAGLAPQHEMRGFCLLGTSSGGEPVDLQAAANLLGAINDLLGLSLDITLMEPVITEQKANVAEDVDMNYR